MSPSATRSDRQLLQELHHLAPMGAHKPSHFLTERGSDLR